MNADTRESITRRTMLASSAGALIFAAPQALQQPVRVILQRGMSGGGLAQLENGDEPRLANFGLFASSMQLPEGTTLVLGAIQWIEAGTGFQLQSLEVTQCQPLEGRSDGAEVRGRMQVNGEGDYPFVARVIDGGSPGSALDRIEIEVNTPNALEGAAAAEGDDTITYEAAGNLVGGDVQWIIADIKV